ncbi:MAG TPA: hypothetical protein VLJ61_15185 [Pyrinomonadaceae bacterium]|nr:hypothetical protein [Pyrinomonadaceae bacterium]
MTPQDHNKVIGIMHLIWGGFNALTMLIFVPFLLAMIGVIGSDPHSPPELKMVFGALGLFFAVLAVLFGIPPLIAGYAMLKRKSWARVAAIVSSCFAALSFPFGTALCVYTFWFVFSEGERFYSDAGEQQAWRGSLPNYNAYDRDAQSGADASRRKEYSPPRQPPDWRD